MRRVTVNNETYNSPEQDYYWLDADTYFDIQDNIDLGGDTLYGVKESSIFAFHGGSLSNGMIYGVLNVEAGAYQIFQNNVDLNNSELMIKAPYILPEWFGAGTGTDDYAALKLAFDIAALSSQIVRLTGQYSLGNNAEPLVVDKNCTLLFAGGSLLNGILGGYINLKTESNDIFGNNLTFEEGTEMNVPYLRSEWFGAKGDYNPDTHTGTDDTAAISRAVRTAEILSIKTVKFNAVNYLVSGNGIMIYRGNIILEGSGAMLREEQMISVYQKEYNNKGDYVKTLNGYQTGIETKLTVPHEEVDNVYLNKNSAIYCQSEKTKGTEYDESDPILNRCITCYKGNEYYWRDGDKIKDKNDNQIGVIKEFLRYGVSDPIYIKDLQFICDVVPKDNTKSETTTKDSSDKNTETKTLPEYLSDDKRCIGIDYQATFSGPTWPVIIERCYFKGFAVAFLLNSEYSYCIHCLTFRDNAFAQNIWCVYSNNYEITFQDDGGPTIQCSWAFEFVDNRCHQNDFLIRICVQKGLCLIENNNTEGTLGDCPDDNPTYAIDVQLAQGAVARICHNHFESNHTRLIKVVGYYGNDCKAVVIESNTDGMKEQYAKFNLCYFANVTLETDMNAIISNCLVESKMPNTKKLLLEDAYEKKTLNNSTTINYHYFNSAYMHHRGNRILEDIQNVATFYSMPIGGFARVIDTPYGRKMMACQFKQSNEHWLHIFEETTIYDTLNDDAQYLLIEFPYYRFGQGTFSYLEITIKYGEKVIHYNISDAEDKSNHEALFKPQNILPQTSSPQIIYSKYDGFYWARLQLGLEHGTKQQVKAQIAMYIPNNTNEMVYTGAVTFATSYSKYDPNMQLNTGNFEIKFSGINNEKLFIEEHDRFVADNYEITCLKAGYTEVGREFFPYNDGNDNIAITRPVLLGTTWAMGDIAFQIVGLVDNSFVNEDGSVNSKGKYLKYYIRIIRGTYSDISMVNSMSGAFDSVKPVLLGRGNGSSGEMNSDIVPYLCEGSTFYNVTDGKMYVRTATGIWKEL